MSTFTQSLRQLRCQGKAFRAPWPQPAFPRQSFPLAVRSIATETSTPIVEPKPDDFAVSTDASSKFTIPFQGVEHARAVPLSASYFSREPQFNEMYLRIARLLTKYHALPTVPSSSAPPTAWVKLQEMRSKLGEPIKASHYAKVIRVAKRLNQIEPTLFPAEVRVALEDFKRDINPFMNVPHEVTIDKYGRAVGVGKRKESTARAWVVEGTGEVLINGKTLSQAFGRVHDRESAVWALQATERLDKYNVWALVEGGGTTGQAEALTLAVAKALIVHEPALKTALRKAGCITRDPRTVERKKHGHVKARKMPAWVKR
ncbi:37S ribosomal protein S9, mitochondrial [Fusarium chlamydosporum]